MKPSEIKPSRPTKPIEYLYLYYDIIPMEEFEITNMADSPYHFNCVHSLVNCKGEIRDALLRTLLLDPERFERSRKMIR